MSPDEIICAYEPCGKTVQKTTHNMKYCSDECCRTATNLKIRQKYYENKERLNGKKRVCEKRGCSNVLSRYNTTKVCASCAAKSESLARNALLEMVRGVAG